MAVNFSEQLRKLRRQTAATSGRQPSREEVSGVAEGVAESASSRLARSRGLELEEKRLGQQEGQFQETLEERRRTTDLEVAAAESASKRQEKAQRATTTVAGGALGAYAGASLGAAGGAAGGAAAAGAAGGAGAAATGAQAGSVLGPYGAVVGAVVGAIIGFVASDSWICGAVEKESGLDLSTSKTLLKFKEYALKHHKLKAEYYLEVGPELVEEMIKQGANFMFIELKDELVLPVVRLFDSGEPEKSYELYKHKILELMAMYKPELLKGVPNGE